MLSIILICICWILAAICNAVMDVLAFKYKLSVFKKLNPDFWNPSISWRNKYKNNLYNQGPAFFGSTTFFAFTTDAWHLFQFLSNSFMTLSLVILINDLFDTSLLTNILIFFGFKFIFGSTFELFYSKFFRK